MKRLLLALLAALCFAGQADLFRQVDSMSAELAEMTGLTLKKRVDRDFITRDMLKQYLEDKIKEIVKPEEIRAEELTLKKFGLVPADFDLKKTTIELLTEQAAAFYDFHRKRLFVLEGTSDETQRMALVHELAHALADQHFNLERYMNRGSSDDSAMARGAIMEGQAQWLMFEYMARHMGTSLKDRADLLNPVTGGVEGTAQFPELEKAPLYMKESLLFPYMSGMHFMHVVHGRLGQPAFERVFRRPPESTQQIIHPELYFEGRKPVNPPLPEFRSAGYRELAAGSIGELDHSVLLRQYATRQDAEEVARKWRGGRYRVLEKKGGGDLVLLYAVEWQDQSTAERYYSLYRDKVLRGKWKKLEILRDDGDRTEGIGDDGRFVLVRSGTRVTSVEGIR